MSDFYIQNTNVLVFLCVIFKKQNIQKLFNPNMNRKWS